MVPEAVRQADHARHQGLGQFGGHFHPAHPALHRNQVAVRHAQSCSVAGVQHQGAAVCAAHQPRGVVHPGVVAPQLPPPDQHEGGRGRVQESLQARQIGQQRFGSEVQPPVCGQQLFWQAARHRAEVQAVWRGVQVVQTQGVRAVLQAQRQPRRGVTALLAGQALAQPLEDLPVEALVRPDGEHRGVQTRGVANRKMVKDHVVVLDFQPEGGRQDDVGVPGGLVEVGVHGHHKFQPRQGRVQALTARRAQHRVSRDAHEGPDLTRARRVHLLGQRGARQLAVELRQSAHP